MAKRSVTGGDEGRRSVDAYIAAGPRAARAGLRQLRSMIRAVAPDAGETTSYFGFPGYFYPGYDYNGMFVWFSCKGSTLGLHLRPPTIEQHARDLALYATTKAIVRFPVGAPIPGSLVKKLVAASLKVMRDRAESA